MNHATTRTRTVPSESSRERLPSRVSVGREPWLAVAAIVLAAVALGISSDLVVGPSPAFLTVFFTLVISCNVLTVVVLVAHYRTGGSPRALALAWTYGWSGLVLFVHSVVVPGIWVETGLLGFTPEDGSLIWTAWLLGLVALLALALAPWPLTVADVLSSSGHRMRRTFRGLGVIAVGVAGTFAIVAVSGPRAASVAGTDSTTLVDGVGPLVILVCLAAVTAGVAGILQARVHVGMEGWGLASLVAVVCQMALALNVSGPSTVAWYGARGLAVFAAIVVLFSMLRDSSRLHREVRGYAIRAAEQREALLQAEALRQHLIAVMTHEMRTPLTGLRGYLEMMTQGAMGDLPPHAQRAADRCMVLTRRASLLTEDLLAADTAANGEVKVEPETLTLAAELEAAAGGFPEIEILIECSQDVEIVADPLRLQQILANLLRNAQKYGEPPVVITVGRYQGSVAIEVRDAGDGVPESFRADLFERWTRAGGTTEGGSGLGLSIVRDLMTAMNGSVGYRGDSNTFVLSFPLPQAGEAAEAADVVSIDRRRSIS